MLQARFKAEGRSNQWEAGANTEIFCSLIPRPVHNENRIPHSISDKEIDNPIDQIPFKITFSRTLPSRRNDRQVSLRIHVSTQGNELYPRAEFMMPRGHLRAGRLIHKGRDRFGNRLCTVNLEDRDYKIRLDRRKIPRSSDDVISNNRIAARSLVSNGAA